MAASRNIFIIIACSVLFLLQCVKSIRETEIGPADAKNRIAIATYYSDFKSAVTQGLVDRFKNRAKITVFSLDHIGRIDPHQYDVVVIADALMGWQIFNAVTRGFILNTKDPADREKIVLFLTAADPKKNYKFQGIDCITSASQMNRDGEIVEEISAKINSILR